MEEPGNLFICSLLLYSMFPSLLHMLLYMPFPRSTINVHKLCSKVQETWSIHVLFYALIYTSQKKHWMIECSAPAVQDGSIYHLVSQLVNNQLVKNNNNNNNNNNKILQMWSPSLKCAELVGGLLNTSSLLYYCI